MATITMDTSEYEALKKNIELLEEAKRKESRLNEDIKKLQKEKMQVLLDAQKSVSIVKRNVREEIIYLKKSKEDIIKGAQLLVNNYYSRSLNSFNESMFIDYFFEKIANIDDKDVTVATKGLDEIKTVLREEIIKEVASETASKLKELEYLKNKEKLIDEQSAIFNIEMANIENTKILNHKLNQENEKLREENLEICNKHQRIRTEIYSLANNVSWNIFNYLDKNVKLKQILREDNPINKN